MLVHVEPEIQDYAPVVYRDIIKVLSHLKCDIVLRRVRKKIKKKRQAYLKYPVLTKGEAGHMRAMVVFSPYATSHQAKKWSDTLGIPLLHLEKGFLPKSILCDSGGFWGESLLRKHIGQELESISNEDRCWSDSYSRYLIDNNISKRTQSDNNVEPHDKFVFLPMQYMNDQSVLRFGNMPYQKFMKHVGAFCADNNIILVVKKHPHAYRKETQAVDKILRYLKRRHGKYLMVVEGSVHYYCQNCLFMVGMNTGAVIDGLVNKCVISHCGQSIFENSGAVIHNNNIPEGLQQCLSVSADQLHKLRVCQSSLIYYLYNRYLLLEEDTHASELTNETKIASQLSGILS